MTTKIKELTTLDPQDALPGIAVNCVIFGFNEGRIKVLLSKFPNFDKWMLPTGFVHKMEDVDNAALRTLESRTGLKNATLRQFHLFGNCTRSSMDDKRKMLNALGCEVEKMGWYMQRFVSVGYYCLVRFNEVEANKVFPDHFVSWVDIDCLPNMYADNADIIKKARTTIRQQMGNIPIGYELLPDKFTMPEIRTIYETFLERGLDRRNFQRKMLSIGYLKRLEETRKEGNHKAPRLYSFLNDRYELAAELGIQIMSWSMYK